MGFIHYEKQKKFIFGIKANRLIALSLEERKKGQYHNLKTLGLKDGENRLILRANQMGFHELKKIREQFTPA